MADQKITEFTELDATPDDADIVAIVDDVAGTPVTKKIKISNLLGTEVSNETPTGLINGSNKVFTLANAPSPAGSLKVFLNGSFRTAGGEDYTLVTNTITFINAPLSGSVLRVFYKY